MGFLKLEAYYTENHHFLIFGSGYPYQMQSLILTTVQRNTRTAFLHHYHLKLSVFLQTVYKPKCRPVWEAIIQQA